MEVKTKLNGGILFREVGEPLEVKKILLPSKCLSHDGSVVNPSSTCLHEVLSLQGIESNLNFANKNVGCAVDDKPSEKELAFYNGFFVELLLPCLHFL